MNDGKEQLIGYTHAGQCTELYIKMLQREIRANQLKEKQQEKE